MSHFHTNHHTAQHPVAPIAPAARSRRIVSFLLRAVMIALFACTALGALAGSLPVNAAQPDGRYDVPRYVPPQTNPAFTFRRTEGGDGERGFAGIVIGPTGYHQPGEYSPYEPITHPVIAEGTTPTSITCKTADTDVVVSDVKNTSSEGRWVVSYKVTVSCLKVVMKTPYEGTEAFSGFTAHPVKKYAPDAAGVATGVRVFHLRPDNSELTVTVATSDGTISSNPVTVPKS